MSTSIRLRNVVESLRKNLTASKWQEILNLIQGKGDQEVVSPSHLSLILSLIQRDLSVSSQTDLTASCLYFLSQVLADPRLYALFDLCEIGKMLEMIAMKCMEYHCLPNEKWAKWGIGLVQGLTKSPRTETICVSSLKLTIDYIDDVKIHTRQDSLPFPGKLHSLVPKTHDPCLTDACEELYNSKSHLFLTESESDEVWIEEFKSQSLQNCLEMLNKSSIAPSKLLKATSFLILALGTKLHRSPILNQLLNIIETQFNSSNSSSRSLAFHVWRRLILNFELKGHLHHPKRITLILIPITNGLKYENNESVYQECLTTFTFVLVCLASRGKGNGKIIRDILCKSLCSEMLAQTAFMTHFVSLLCSLIRNREWEKMEWETLYNVMDGSSKILLESMNPLQDSFIFDFMLQMMEKLITCPHVSIPLLDSLWNALLTRASLSHEHQQLHFDEMESFLKKGHPEFQQKTQSLRDALTKAKFACSDLSVYSEFPGTVQHSERILDSLPVAHKSPLQAVENLVFLESDSTPLLTKRKRNTDFLDAVADLMQLEHQVEFLSGKECRLIERDLTRILGKIQSKNSC